MSTDKGMIMVVERATLFRERSFTGFLPAEANDYEALIIANATYRPREHAEKDPSFKQPIAYAAIVNPGRGRVFAYRRASEAGRYDEARLRGKWSWGVGGHIEEADARGRNPIRDSLRRELAEEIDIPGTFSLAVAGYVNDDETDVGAVHFGILYIAETDAAEVTPRSPEIAAGGLHPIETLEEILRSPACSVETWSAIALPAIKAALERGRQREAQAGSIPK
jgi:predicted NUDIX family phosphoesterase